MFHRNKGLDLSLGDSNYAPAINPNNLAPQAATGTRVSAPQQTKTERQQQKQQQAKQQTKQRLTNTVGDKPPTIINNYYYVQPQPPAPQPSHYSAPQPQMIDPRYSQAPLPPPRNGSSGHHGSYSPGKSQLTHSSGSRRSSSHKLAENSDYDNFVNSASRSHRVASGAHSPLKHKTSASIYDSASLRSADSGYRGTGEKKYISTKLQAKVPNIDFYDDSEDKSTSLLKKKVRNVNLIGVLSRIDDEDVSVHNEQLFALFREISNGDEILTFDTLSRILCDPFEPAGRLLFDQKSVSILLNTFSNTRDLNFRNFIKLSKFAKGCLVSFMFHDRDRSHTLSFDEFASALKSNSMVCPDELLARLFEKSENLDFESYLIGIISIRSLERRRHS